MLAIMPIFRGNPRKLGLFPAELPVDVLDDHIAIVGTARFGQTYTAKGFVEHLLESGALDRLIAMKLTASQDRDAIGAWIEGGHRADCLCGLEIQLKLAAIL